MFEQIVARAIIRGYAVSPKLEVYRANQDQIRYQLPRLRRNTLILGRKAGGGGSPVVPTSLLLVLLFFLL